MKRLLLIALVASCSTTQVIESWKNPDIESYEPYKVLVVGMTSNTEAREKFERRLKEEFQSLGIESVMSLEILNATTSKKSEEELKEIENDLIKAGFDTILFTRITGVEDNVSFAQTYRNYKNTYRSFTNEYYNSQDIYYNPDYYEAYKVYHAETLLYCICPTKERELIWKGYIDIIDPKSIEDTVDDYVNSLITTLEEEYLISK